MEEEMNEATMNQTKTLTSSRLAGSGAIAGLAGGVVFGVMMGMMGMLPMVSMLIRQENAVIGFVVHMAISAFIGAVYGLIAGRFALTWLNAVIGGAVNGIVWWILGALILMPLFLGMNEMILVIGSAQWMSLLGHILYGLVTAFVFIPLARRN
jgi:uncharacterized membrane protein YagU involved in acid resistance